jgi:serine protease
MRLKGLITTALIIAIASAAVADDLIEANPNQYDGYAPQYLPNEIVVRFRQDVSRETIERFNAQNGAVEILNTPYLARLRIPESASVQEFVRRYVESGLVEYAEPNFIARAYFAPNDRYYRYQWNLSDPDNGIDVERAWEISTGEGVIVAVLDTGIAYEDYGDYKLASDLARTKFVPGYDFVNDDPHPNDDNGHGTHVAGTIAQSTDNGEGTAGVAFNATIMPIKVLDKSGYGNYADIARGIYYAADHGAKVINLSLGGSYPSKTLENAVAYAFDKGAVIVAAVGNGYLNGNPTSYPAAYDQYVIAVGATRFDGERAPYSNVSEHVDLAAPGGDLSVDQNRDGFKDGILQQTFSADPSRFGYWFFQGTSMATPHVSGVAALVIATGVDDPVRVREALEMTARDRGRKGWDEEYGYGIVDAYAAVTYFNRDAVSPVQIRITELVVPDKSVKGEPVEIAAKIFNDEDKQIPIILRLRDKTFNRQLALKVIILKARKVETVRLQVKTDKLEIGEHAITAEISLATDPYNPVDIRGTRLNLVESVKDAAEEKPELPKDIFVADIDLNFGFKLENWEATAEVKILSETGDPVPNVTVYGEWSGDIQKEVTGTTDGSGKVTFTTGPIEKIIRGVSFTVKDVVKPGYRYNPAMNMKGPVTQVEPDRLSLEESGKIVLHPNYPNPANPETWIPFELGKSGRVSIAIYDPNGRLVRRLDLGYRDAGSYVDRSRAAYWDGRNESGEPVASGIYYYAVQVGSQRAVRRLVVLR